MQNSTLNSRAAAEANIDRDFKLQHFTYNNTSILDILDHYLSETDFLGISVRQAKLSCFILPKYNTVRNLYFEQAYIDYIAILADTQTAIGMTANALSSAVQYVSVKYPITLQ